MSPDLSANALFRVDGMVAVITGGATGLGLIMARALAANGAKRVYLLGRRADALTRAAKEHPGIFDAVICDVTSKDSLAQVVAKITRDIGYVNLVVANAGAIGSAQRWETQNGKTPLSEVKKALFEENDMAKMNDAFNVNTTGAFFTIAAFLELLDAGNKRAVKGVGGSTNGDGKEEVVFGKPIKEGGKNPSIQSQVIVTSSIAAYSRMGASPPAYLGSKAAVMQIAKQASTALAPYGIRVNALAPGIFPSELASGIIANRDPETEGPDHPAFIPAQRFGTDEEMAGTILYLASRAGAFCNGSVLVMDGGRLSIGQSTY
ncbi:hypothetical protein V8F20_004212 [Naviculisporaceae sp. PSN 640]